MHMFYYSCPEQFLSLEEGHQEIQVPNMTSQMQLSLSYHNSHANEVPMPMMKII